MPGRAHGALSAGSTNGKGADEVNGRVRHALRHHRRPPCRDQMKTVSRSTPCTATSRTFEERQFPRREEAAQGVLPPAGMPRWDPDAMRPLRDGGVSSSV